MNVQTPLVKKNIFISYAHEDDEFAKLLSNKLKEKFDSEGIDSSIEPWRDQEQLQGGEDWKNKLDSAIRSSYVVLVIFTRHSYESQFVTYEWTYALFNNIPIIPLLRSGVKADELHPQLRSLHAIPVDKENLKQNNSTWDTLADAIRREIHNQLEPTLKLEAPAPDYLIKLVERLNSHRMNDRKAAVDGLRRVNSADFHFLERPLILLLANENSPDIRESVVDLLGKNLVNLPSVREALVFQLFNSDTRAIRSAAAKKLSRASKGRKDILASLKKALKIEQDGRVKKTISGAIELISQS